MSSDTPRDSESPTPDPVAFARNMAEVAIRSQRLIGDFLVRQAGKAGTQPLDPLNISGAFLAMLKGFAADPTRLVEAHARLTRDYLTLVGRSFQRLMGAEVAPVVAPAPGDRRFRAKEWEENQVFDFIKQSYLLTANWLEQTAGSTQGLDSRTQRRIGFYAKQFADAIAPTNFALTNPEVLRETVASNGENLVKGLNNLLEDIERGEGNLSIRQTTDDFAIGKDIATTPGKVVFRNELIELIQYTPATEQVYEIPLVIFPPWINKFYLLDLQPKNSFVRWAVARGYTVFIVSWVNPDARLADKSFADYMREGIFAALDAARDATGSAKANVIGYCIAGTLLSATLAYIAATGEYKDRIASITFFAAQADFSESGDLQVFIDDEQLAAMEQQMRDAGGVLEGSKMATTFNMLRANDLIWNFVVSNYLMGKEPVPFDLLYWNSDTTRMPIQLHMDYLRSCYHENALALGKMVIAGVTLDLSKVKTPAYFQAAKEDHIAPAASVYKGAKLFGGPVTFMLAGSGHIAGVVNPPTANKYQHWINDKAGTALPATIEDWQVGATEHPGSWWPAWDAWLGTRSGAQVPARLPGDAKLKLLGDAPGRYVRIKAGTLNRRKNGGAQPQ